MDKTWFVLVLLAYLLGSIPFGLLIGRARGIDVRKHGSGNIGATNVKRVVGRTWGHLCLVLDILKGFIPTIVAWRMIVPESPDASAGLRWILVGLATVLGHTFPIYLKFRGGKGVSTTIGVALGIFPYFTVAMIAALLGYAIARLATGVVAAGSLALAVVFPIAVFVYLKLDGVPLNHAWPMITVSIVLGLLIIVRHHSNIMRLLSGQEDRVGESGA